MYGGVDSWLLYKLTGNHITEVSSMSAVKSASELKTNNGRARD